MEGVHSKQYEAFIQCLAGSTSITGDNVDEFKISMPIDPPVLLNRESIIRDLDAEKVERQFDVMQRTTRSNPSLAVSILLENNRRWSQAKIQAEKKYFELMGLNKQNPNYLWIGVVIIFSFCFTCYKI